MTEISSDRFSHKKIFFNGDNFSEDPYDLILGELNNDSILSALQHGSMLLSPWLNHKTLLPGENLDLKTGASSFPSISRSENVNEPTDCLKKLLNKTLRVHQEAAISFSGGVDSGVLAALALEAGVKLHAVTVKFGSNDPDFENASQIASQLGLILHTVEFSAEKALSTLPLIKTMSTFCTDSSALSTFLVRDKLNELKKGQLPFIDGCLADTLFPSFSSATKLNFYYRIPYTFRRALSLPSKVLWKSDTKTVDHFRKLFKLSQSKILFHHKNPYSGILFKTPNNPAFYDSCIERLYEMYKQEVSSEYAGICIKLILSSLGCTCQKYTAKPKTDLVLPFASEELIHTVLSNRQVFWHNKIEKYHLKELLCCYVARENAYVKKRGFSMNQKEVFSHPIFLDYVQQVLKDKDFVDHYLHKRNFEIVAKDLERGAPLNWFLYNAIWSLVCLHQWITVDRVGIKVN